MGLRLLLSSGKTIWSSRTSQSIRFCRAVKLEDIKETKDVILKEDLDIKKGISALKNLQITIGSGD